MMTGAIGRLLRLAAVAALAGLAVGCASPQGPGSMTAPAGFGKDPASRMARLVQYCDRLAEKGELVTALGLCGRAHEIDPEAPEPLMKVSAQLKRVAGGRAPTFRGLGALVHDRVRSEMLRVYQESTPVPCLDQTAMAPSRGRPEALPPL